MVLTYTVQNFYSYKLKDYYKILNKRQKSM